MSVFPTEREKLYTHGIIAFLLGATIALLIIDDTMEVNDYFVSLATLVAAFLGASLAFKLNTDKEIRRERSNNKEAINFALFTLLRQRNAILVFKNSLKDYTSDFELAFNFPAYKNADYDDLKHNFNNLGFILESENPNVLMRLSVEQERFEQALTAVKIRNDFYVNEFQPILSDKKLNGRKVDLETFQRELGDRIYGACVQGAKEMRDHIILCDESIPKMHKELFDLAKTTFPGEKFVKWDKKA